MSRHKQKLNFGVIGAGAWGTAFAKLAAHTGNKVLLWDRNLEVITSINAQHINTLYFPDTQLPKEIIGVASLQNLSECDILVIALPFQVIRDFLNTPQMLPLLNKTFLLLSKGIEISTHALGHQIFIDSKNQGTFAALSGPNFASEIIKGLPAAAIIASYDSSTTSSIKASLMCPNMRIYESSDVIGVEACGAVKNIIALAAGITIGAGYGENAKATLICRSLVEIENLVRELGGMRDTVFSLAGIGDLMLTCGSQTSRNFTFGFAIGKQGHIGDLLKVNSKTIEGIFTAKAVESLATQKGISMPICKEVYEILFHNKKISESLSALMTRA